MKALEFTAGPVLLKEKFQVLDIPASFNLLLGRPWIHAIEAVPSTLHQKVKQGNHVISILGDSFLSKCRSLSWQNQSRNIYPCLILVTMSLMEMFRSPPRLGRRHQGILEPIHDQAIEPPFYGDWKKRRRKEEEYLNLCLPRVVRQEGMVSMIIADPVATIHSHHPSRWSTTQWVFSFSAEVCPK